MIEVLDYGLRDLEERLPRLGAYVARADRVPNSRYPAWVMILHRALGHTPYCLEAVEEGETRGILLLSFVRSLLFGRYLVSLPYLNYGGVLADDDRVASLLIDRAIELADRLDVRFLELRHEHPV